MKTTEYDGVNDRLRLRIRSPTAVVMLVLSKNFFSRSFVLDCNFLRKSDFCLFWKRNIGDNEEDLTVDSLVWRQSLKKENEFVYAYVLEVSRL